jgi:hypothetical protein
MSAVTSCNDGDGDGFGNPGDVSCPNGSQNDCDDTNSVINPDITEICDGIDNNCDGNIDEGFAVDFNDVTYEYWAWAYIRSIACAGIATGYDDSTYKPYRTVNRAQMAIFIIRALYGDDFSYSSTPYFPDATGSHWAFKYIQKMYEEGIATGYEDGTYRPSNQVNRAQMAIIMARAFLGM